MKLIVGLGNPGEKYQYTRHNVGFLTVGKLAEKYNAEWKSDKKFKAETAKINSDIILVKPQTFMNSSGSSVAKVKNYFNVKETDLWVIHDDLDIKLGQYKIQLGVGPKIHNGLNSIYEKLSSQNFWHIRVGIDNRPADNRISGETYVLQEFDNKEKETIQQVISGIVGELSVKFSNERA